MKIIGLSGKIGTGKTTLANLLRGVTEFRIRSFAALLKKEVAEFFKMDMGIFYHSKDQWLCLPEIVFVDGVKAVLPGAGKLTARRLLQWWGTEFRRGQDPAYWVNEMLRVLENDRREGAPGVVIDDVRFPDELELVEDMDGLTVRLEPYGGWSCAEEAAAHISETALDRTTFNIRMKPPQGGLALASAFIMKHKYMGGLK